MAENRRISDIECLRAIAVLFVIVCHARATLFPWSKPLWDHIADHYFNFWPGVDLFFAVSGFVIARTLLPTLRQCESATAFLRAALAFWIRRIWRLLPSAWLWLALMLAGSIFFNRTGAFGTFHANFEATIAGMLSVANFRLAGCVDPLAPDGGLSTHYWSLSLEEQFYLLLPITVFFARRRLVPILLTALIIFFVWPQTTPLMAFRLQPILLGVLIALFTEQPAYGLFDPAILGRKPVVSFLLLVTVLALISTLAVFGEQITPHNVDVIALLSALLVLIASYDQDYLCSSPWLKQGLGWLGSRSYALYLLHKFAFVATREIWFRLQPPGTLFGATYTLRFGLTAIVLMILLAEINYRLIERPLRNYGKSIAERVAVRAI